MQQDFKSPTYVFVYQKDEKVKKENEVLKL